MPNSSFKSVAFVASPTEPAQQALRELVERYGNTDISKADVIVALGGDGLMLRTAHEHMTSSIPIYGMHRGSVGFMMNEYHVEDLLKRLDNSEFTEVHPLTMTAKLEDGSIQHARAINEVSLIRKMHQAAKLRIYIDGKVRMKELICDGLLLSTPAGSTAYNLSAHGPILPIDAQLLALTPISPFRPRRWRGALLPNNAKVKIEVIESKDRPVNAAADYNEFRKIQWVEISEDASISIPMLFDPGHNFAERIIQEQFY